MLATVIKEHLADVFIYGVQAKQLDRIDLLNFDDAIATQALNAEQVSALARMRVYRSCLIRT